MTQLTTREAICVGDVAYEVHEMALAAETVKAAELTGQLVIAQQVDVDGNPFFITEPCKDRSSLSPEAWDAYVREINRLQRNFQALPRVTLPPYIGTLRFLGTTASHCALDKQGSTTALIPLQPVPARKKHPAYGFRLYQVESPTTS